MSKRLRRLARKAKLRRVGGNGDGGAHGCAQCRSHDAREQLVKWIIERGQIVSHVVRCPECGCSWLVAFSADEKGEALVTWTPAPSSPSSPN